MIVKICGLTNPEDAQMAMDLGADLLGFVNAERSPRYLTPDEISRIIAEINPIVPTVLVTHSQDVTDILNNFEAAGTDILQAHAALTPDEYTELKDAVPTLIVNVSVDANLKSATEALKKRVSELSQIADYLLFDTKFGAEIGGTGRPYDWSIAAELKGHSQKPVIMAGGLTPKNVAEAIKSARPFGVDVSSGVESSVGIKDYNLVKEFIRQAKSPL
jgi:phosphoribosylanthranilate isomerase